MTVYLAAGQVKGITDGGLKPRRIKKIAVLGGGLMGSGIATASALAGIEVIVKEVNQKFLEVPCHLLLPPCLSKELMNV